jgi:ubiquinone/menaquinone biosynthesis C-methylase UbiE
MAELSHYWDDQAATFDDEPDHGLRDAVTRSAWTKLLAAYLPPVPASIADVGCGTGTLAILLRAAGYRVHGLDFSAAMITQAGAKAAAAELDVEFSVADAMSPPWRAGSFDCVIARHVLWALPDPELGLDRWLSLLRPDGRLALIEGRWSTGAGLTAERTVSLLADSGRTTTVTELTDPALWGRPGDDERYLVLSDPR